MKPDHLILIYGFISLPIRATNRTTVRNQITAHTAESGSTGAIGAARQVGARASRWLTVDGAGSRRPINRHRETLRSHATSTGYMKTNENGRKGVSRQWGGSKLGCPGPIEGQEAERGVR